MSTQQLYTEMTAADVLMQPASVRQGHPIRVILGEHATNVYIAEHGLDRGYASIEVAMLQPYVTEYDYPAVLLVIGAEGGAQVLARTTLRALEDAMAALRALAP